MKGYEPMGTALCGGCKHFRQHYVKYDSDYYVQIDYGHCVYPHRKKRRADETCPHWTTADAPPECPL